MDTHTRRQLLAALIVVIIVATSFSVFFAYQLFKPVPAYEFKTGVNHPQEISGLINNGTVVLYFSMNDCPPCDDVAPKIADLQSHYNGTNVTFKTFNLEDNATSQRIFFSYGIQWVPQVFVIRPDGAVANFTMKKDSGSDSFHAMDFNAIRSAIEEARHG